MMMARPPTDAIRGYRGPRFLCGNFQNMILNDHLNFVDSFLSLLNTRKNLYTRTAVRIKPLNEWFQISKISINSTYKDFNCVP